MERVSFEDWGKSNEYLYQALEESDLEVREELLFKALEINEYNIDAIVEIANLIDNEFMKLGMLNEAISFASEYLEEVEDISEEDESMFGDFWVMSETRPFMRAKYAHLEQLIQVGYLAEANLEAGHMLLLNENDNQGVRYIAQTLNVAMSNYTNSVELRKRFPEETFLLNFGHVLICFENRKRAEAKKTFKELLKVYPDIIDVLDEKIEFEKEEIIAAIEGDYEPYSNQEVLAGLITFSDDVTVELIEWINKEFKLN